MILTRKYFSDDKEEERKKVAERNKREEKKELLKKGVVAGSTMAGIGGGMEWLRHSNKKLAKKVLRRPPKSIEKLKYGRWISAAGAPLAGYSLYKYNKIKKDEKNDNSKA